MKRRLWQLGDRKHLSGQEMSGDINKRSTTSQLSIAVLLTVTLFIAIPLAGWHAFGIRGIAPASSLVAVAWFALSRTKSPAFRAINRNRMTIPELLTMITICLIVHGLTIPTVSSRKHQRTPSGPSGAATVTQPSGNATPSIDPFPNNE